MRKSLFIEKLLWLVIMGLLFIIGIASMLIFKIKNPLYIAIMLIIAFILIIQIILFINAFSDYSLERKALRKDDKVQGIYLNKKSAYRFNKSLDTSFVNTRYKIQYSFENDNGETIILETRALFDSEQARNIENMGSFVLYKLDQKMAILVYEKIEF